MGRPPLVFAPEPGALPTTPQGHADIFFQVVPRLSCFHVLLMTVAAPARHTSQAHLRAASDTPAGRLAEERLGAGWLEGREEEHRARTKSGRREMKFRGQK